MNDNMHSSGFCRVHSNRSTVVVKGLTSVILSDRALIFLVPSHCRQYSDLKCNKALLQTSKFSLTWLTNHRSDCASKQFLQYTYKEDNHLELVKTCKYFGVLLCLSSI